MKLSQRYSIESLAIGSEEDSQGRLFCNNSGMEDLTDVEIVGASVDTVRQLFTGVPLLHILETLDGLIEQKEQFFNLSLPSVDTFGNTELFHLAKMGKTARYRYKLQNNELGIVILFCSYYGKLENEGQHLKIELSPKFIAHRSAESTMQFMTAISNKLLLDSKVKGCAVHLACDYQGYKLPDDFIQRLSTYTRTIRAYDGCATVDLSDLSEAVATYGGKNQERNYLIGKANSVQMAIYDKSYEIIKSDKQDYFHNEWGVYSLGVFDPEKTVRRIEARIHHSVVREIGQGLGVELEDFLSVSKYLTDIWRYALRINRLNNQQGKDLVHPFWQLLMQDVEFTVPAQNIKIARKKKQSVDPIAHNITSLIGNFISLCFRQGFKADDVMLHLRVLPFYPRIKQYYKERGLNETDIKDMVNESLKKRQTLSRLAV